MDRPVEPRIAPPPLGDRGGLPKGHPVPGFGGALAAAAVALLGALAVIDAPRGASAASLVAAALGASAIAVLAARHYPHARFGPCNGVTLLRGALAVALVAPLAAGMAAGWIVAAIAGLALALDGIDGWLARRQGLVSRFGAAFDMEVDAVLAALLAAHGALAGLPLPAMLVLGGARYAFVAAARVWPWLSAPLPPALWRKAVCVAQIGALIALQLPGLPAAQPLAWVAAVLVLSSFARDIVWLRARAR